MYLKKWLFFVFQEVTSYAFLHAVGLKLEGCNLVHKSAIMHPVELIVSQYDNTYVYDTN